MFDGNQDVGRKISTEIENPRSPFLAMVWSGWAVSGHGVVDRGRGGIPYDQVDELGVGEEVGTDGIPIVESPRRKPSTLDPLFSWKFALDSAEMVRLI